eukprot:TRINITY_DN15147_c0_g1_i2.p1 TRINITY_DN15147_c0_g1~~TRINITY_DN15147_c0_g1_i2.p1  ORF type:complete len:398 (-),score=50.91 TRINITY_DN15147_c0_g1_i2:27-1220(-)
MGMAIRNVDSTGDWRDFGQQPAPGTSWKSPCALGPLRANSAYTVRLHVTTAHGTSTFYHVLQTAEFSPALVIVATGAHEVIVQWQDAADLAGFASAYIRGGLTITSCASEWEVSIDGIARLSPLHSATQHTFTFSANVKDIEGLATVYNTGLVVTTKQTPGLTETVPAQRPCVIEISDDDTEEPQAKRRRVESKPVLPDGGTGSCCLVVPNWRAGLKKKQAKQHYEALLGPATVRRVAIRNTNFVIEFVSPSMLARAREVAPFRPEQTPLEVTPASAAIKRRPPPPKKATKKRYKNKPGPIEPGAEIVLENFPPEGGKKDIFTRFAGAQRVTFLQAEKKAVVGFSSRQMCERALARRRFQLKKQKVTIRDLHPRTQSRLKSQPKPEPAPVKPETVLL